MIVDNGEQLRLLVPGVFDGIAGVARERLWFVPNMDRADPPRAIVGVLNDQAVRIAPVKDATGPGWTSTFKVMK